MPGSAGKQQFFRVAEFVPHGRLKRPQTQGSPTAFPPMAAPEGSTSKPALPDSVLRAIYGTQTPEEKTAALDASLLKCVARLPWLDQAEQRAGGGRRTRSARTMRGRTWLTR